MGELHIALKTSDITKFCFENRKEKKRIMCITYKKFCCCCCNVVTCSKVFAILGLIGGILNMISAFLSLARAAVFYNQLLARIPTITSLENSLGYYGLFWILIVISVVWMIPDVLLLVGISKKKPGYMMVWLVIRMILLVLFTIYSAVSIFVFLAVVVQYRSGGRGGSAIGLVIYTAAILALLYIGYYLWDIVKSAYKQIKEENENVHPAGNYMMNTYGKS